MAKTPTVKQWIVPPECAGQIVERSYGVDEDGIGWERVTNRSLGEQAEGCMRYSNLGEVTETWDPANRRPRSGDVA